MRKDLSDLPLWKIISNKTGNEYQNKNPPYLFFYYTFFCTKSQGSLKKIYSFVHLRVLRDLWLNTFLFFKKLLRRA